jgi:hypothetical protein
LPDAQLARTWERGCFPTTILARSHRPRRPRHPYAVPRTSLQCVCTRRRNCIEQLPPSMGSSRAPRNSTRTLGLKYGRLPASGSVGCRHALRQRTAPSQREAAGSVPKTSIFGTSIFAERKRGRCWVSEPSFSEGFRNRESLCIKRMLTLRTQEVRLGTCLWLPARRNSKP